MTHDGITHVNVDSLKEALSVLRQRKLHKVLDDTLELELEVFGDGEVEERQAAVAEESHAVWYALYGI